MTAALSDLVRRERGRRRSAQLTGGGITDTPVLPHDRWEAMVRRCAAVDADVARGSSPVSTGRRRLQGLAARFAGEAARADQRPAVA